MNIQNRSVRVITQATDVIELRFAVTPNTFYTLPVWVQELSPPPPTFRGSGHRRPKPGRFFIGSFDNPVPQTSAGRFLRELATVGFTPRDVVVRLKNWFCENHHYQIVLTCTKRGVNDNPERDDLIYRCHELIEYELYASWAVRAFVPNDFENKITISFNGRNQHRAPQQRISIRDSQVLLAPNFTP